MKKKVATNQESLISNKKIKNATKMELDGKKFRSKLEAFTYSLLKDYKIDNRYEEVTYTLMPSYRYIGYEYPLKKKTDKGEAIRSITYTPDFVISDNIIIECKGFSDQKFPLKWKMFKKQLQDKYGENTYLFLIKNQKQAIESVEIIKKLCNDKK